jgi:hypothetical protein
LVKALALRFGRRVERPCVAVVGVATTDVKL